MGAIAILGLGPSLKLYNPQEYEMSVGVNDIWNYHKSEAVICLDRKSAFNAARYLTIETCRPNAFYSQIVNWDFIPGFVKIDLLPNYSETVIDLNLQKFHKSYCSPFVAVQVAFRYYKATYIHLFGVDLVSHPHLDQRMCGRIKHHFTLLAKALRENGCQFIVYGEGILKNI